MGIFGWSLPPGCTHAQIEAAFGAEGPCEVCGHFVDDCVCQECGTCGAQGDPGCYEKHGLVRTQAQIDGHAAREAELDRQEREGEATSRAEAEYWSR
jgi:hypothetical protein